jgi:hypothetical protein
LRKPGEELPDAVNKDQQMKPVQFPDGQKPDEKPKPIPPPPGSTPSQLLDVSEARGVN